MADSDLQRIFATLSGAGVRYIVVGGVAVVLHGHLRFTADLDLFVALDPANALATVQALAGIGYRPRPPVAIEQFADPIARRSWIEEKGMTVFSLWNPAMPGTDIDLFVEEPIAFEEAWTRAVHVDIGTTRLPIGSIIDLIAMKRIAGRPKDAEDISALEAIARAEAEVDE